MLAAERSISRRPSGIGAESEAIGAQYVILERVHKSGRNICSLRYAAHVEHREAALDRARRAARATHWDVF